MSEPVRFSHNSMPWTFKIKVFFYCDHQAGGICPENQLSDVSQGDQLLDARGLPGGAMWLFGTWRTGWRDSMCGQH